MALTYKALSGWNLSSYGKMPTLIWNGLFHSLCTGRSTEGADPEGGLKKKNKALAPTSGMIDHQTSA